MEIEQEIESNNKGIKFKIENEGFIKGHPQFLSKPEIQGMFGKESYIKDYHSEKLSKNPKILIEQMEKSVCKIENKNLFGTGFICLIPKPNSRNLLRVLITCHHVFKDLRIGNEIKLIFENKEKIIKIDKYRKVYTNEQIDFSIIELKKNEFELNDYLKIDDLTERDRDLKEKYIGKEIYIIQFPFGEEIKISDDKIKDINNNEIEHCCSTNSGSSGAPILNLENHKVIGIHCANNLSKDCNLGKIIKSVIDDFNNNYIIAKIEIKEEDINKEIRIINSYEEYKREKQLENNRKDYEYENEKEIKENCEILINENKINFSYFHRFNKKGRYTIKYEFKNYLTRINHMFLECKNITNIDFSHFKTQNIINTSDMFFWCRNLKNINLSNFNFNSQNVTNMSGMFSNCISLDNLNLTNFNNSNVTDISRMFEGCSSLKKINLSNFNTQNITNMSWMFSKCNSLKSIDLANFNTQNVINLHGMFSKCSSLENINLSNFSTQNVTDMAGLFNECNSLTNINISNFNTQNVTDISYMFYECSSLTTIDLSMFNTQNVMNMNNLFSKCTSLTNINISNFNTEKVTDISQMFSYCSSLTNIDLSNFKTQNVQNMKGLFFKCSSLKNLNLSNFNTQKVTEMSFMFSKCSSLTNINLSNFITQNDTDLTCMFNECNSLIKENVIIKDNNITNELNNNGF